MAKMSKGSGVTAELYEIGRRACLAVANDLVDEIQKRAPVDTGNLRDSYQIKEGNSAIGEVIVYTDVDYAPYQEFGTLFQPGTPHIRPALEIIKAKYNLNSVPDVTFRDMLEP